MSILPIDPKGRPRRPLPVVNHWGLLERVVHNDTHDSRRIEHQKMRQTWFQTIIGFLVLGAILGGTAYLLGGLSLLGLVGIIWLSIMGVAWFFSARIATFAVGAYQAVPGTTHGDAAIKATARAWDLVEGMALTKARGRARVNPSPRRLSDSAGVGRGSTTLEHGSTRIRRIRRICSTWGESPHVAA